MARLVIDVPEPLSSSLQPYADRLAEVLAAGLLRLQLTDALHHYREQRISLGHAAELAGVSREEIIHHARAAGIEPAWDETLLAEELA